MPVSPIAHAALPTASTRLRPQAAHPQQDGQAGIISRVAQAFFRIIALLISTLFFWRPTLNISSHPDLFSTGEFDALSAKIASSSETEHFLWFYTARENTDTQVFGNFFPCSVTVDKRTYRCAEAAFQAQKFTNHPTLMDRFTKVDGEGAYQLARRSTHLVAPNWLTRNVDAMRKVLHAKFTQNTQLRALLLKTGGAYLVEHVPTIGRDAFWADNGDGKGKNTLGELLMELRGSFKGVGSVSKHANYTRWLTSTRTS